MDIEDLKPGDVLLFSGERGSLVSEVIMLLTGASVSHAAMVFREPQLIVEETPPAVAVHDAVERFRGRTIFVNRMESGPDSFGPVLDAAQVYVNEEEPYAMSNLYLVGLLLLYKRFTPNTLTKRVLIKILKKLTVGILDRIHERETPGKRPMVCSQFVYRCYEDAGEPYRLGLHDAILGARVLAARDHAAEQSTLDRVLRRVEEGESAELQERLMRAGIQGTPTTPDESEEELLAQLHSALQAEQTSPDPNAAELEEDLVAAVGAFAQAAQAAGPEVRGPAAPAGTPIQALRALHSEQAVFVTPADLLDRCQNLTRVGTIG